MFHTASRVKETVLYYNPDPQPAGATGLKGVLVSMKVRIRNIRPDQAGETVGALLGMDGIEPLEQGKGPEGYPAMDEEMLVMHGFTSRRVDELLMRLRKAGVPKIALKAVVTAENSRWPLGKLFQELKQEHRAMTEGQS